MYDILHNVHQDVGWCNQPQPIVQVDLQVDFASNNM